MLLVQWTRRSVMGRLPTRLYGDGFSGKKRYARRIHVDGCKSGIATPEGMALLMLPALQHGFLIEIVILLNFDGEFVFHGHVWNEA